MRKQAFVLLSISVLAISSLLSCNKVDEQEQEPDVNVKTKIEAWMNKQKLPVNLKTNQQLNDKIQSLQDNLEYKKLKYEVRNQKEKFLIIPVKDGFKSQNNENKNPLNLLVLVLNEQQEISFGNIIQYVPAPGQNRNIPDNTISKIFNYKQINADGLFSVLSVTDFFRYEVRFEKGKIKSLAKPLAKKGGKNARTTGCTDWYLVTTLYYADGSTETFEDYLYTSCTSDDCTTAVRLMNGHVMPTECTGGDSGGSAYGSDCCLPDPSIQLVSSTIAEEKLHFCEPEYVDPATGKTVKSCIHSWYFNTSTVLWYTWKYFSTETAKLEKENGVWKFTSVAHSGMGHDGTKPYCVRFDSEKIISPIPSILNDRTRARMTFMFDIQATWTCWKDVPLAPVNGRAMTEWNAR